jgi:hypothetical protein
LGKTLPSYSVGSTHPAAAKVIFQLGKLLLQDRQGPVPRIHHGKHGVHVDPSKIQAIHDYPSPTTLIELRSILGLANFYHRFVLGLSHIAWALNQVTKGGGKLNFVWVMSQW